MSNFDDEMKRGLDDIVKKTNYRDWVNPENKQDEKIAEDFRAVPVSQSEVEESVSESVDGLPVKDRDLLDDSVEPVQVGDDVKEDHVVVEQSGEAVRGNLEGNGPTNYIATSTDSSESDSQSDVPEGSIKEVTAWVGDDKDRAQAALDEENKKDNPRKSLVEKLEDIIKG